MLISAPHTRSTIHPEGWCVRRCSCWSLRTTAEPLEAPLTLESPPFSGAGVGGPASHSCRGIMVAVRDGKGVCCQESTHCQRPRHLRGARRAGPQGRLLAVTLFAQVKHDCVRRGRDEAWKRILSQMKKLITPTQREVQTPCLKVTRTTERSVMFSSSLGTLVLSGASGFVV